jgi:hypothetical protein
MKHDNAKSRRRARRAGAKTGGAREPTIAEAMEAIWKEAAKPTDAEGLSVPPLEYGPGGLLFIGGPHRKQ